jgi:hypothetical protein
MSTVRNTLNVVRYDWLGVRIGGPGASMRGLWPVLIVALLVVFGCFFAIGRLFAGGGSPLEGSSAAPVAHAAIPSALHGGSPIAGEVPNSIAEPPPQRRAKPARGAEVLRATAPSQAFAGETASTEASSGTRLESAPAQAPEPSRASPGTGSSAGKPSAARASGGAASGSGGSFDSSE